MESYILAKWIAPESINWPERAKKWFFAHGGRLDLETGKLVYGPKLQRAAERFAYALNTSATSVFNPTERRMN
jgi:hypothetical protein